MDPTKLQMMNSLPLPGIHPCKGNIRQLPWPTITQLQLIALLGFHPLPRHMAFIKDSQQGWIELNNAIPLRLGGMPTAVSHLSALLDRTGMTSGSCQDKRLYLVPAKQHKFLACVLKEFLRPATVLVFIYLNKSLLS